MMYDIMPPKDFKLFCVCLKNKNVQHSWTGTYIFDSIPSLCIPEKKVFMYVTLTGDYLYIARQTRDERLVSPVFAGYVSGIHDFVNTMRNYCEIPEMLIPSQKEQD